MATHSECYRSSLKVTEQELSGRKVKQISTCQACAFHVLGLCFLRVWRSSEDLAKCLSLVINVGQREFSIIRAAMENSKLSLILIYPVGNGTLKSFISCRSSSR